MFPIHAFQLLPCLLKSGGWQPRIFSYQDRVKNQASDCLPFFATGRVSGGQGYLLCSLMYDKYLEQYMAHCWDSINIGFTGNIKVLPNNCDKLNQKVFIFVQKKTLKSMHMKGFQKFHKKVHIMEELHGFKIFFALK